MDISINLEHLLYSVAGMLGFGIVTIATLWWGIQKQITSLREALNEKMDGIKDHLSGSVSEVNDKLHRRMDSVENTSRQELNRQIDRFDNVLPIIYGSDDGS